MILQKYPAFWLSSILGNKNSQVKYNRGGATSLVKIDRLLESRDKGCVPTFSTERTVVSSGVPHSRQELDSGDSSTFQTLWSIHFGWLLISMRWAS
jgi:hypothetical protein